MVLRLDCFSTFVRAWPVVFVRMAVPNKTKPTQIAKMIFVLSTLIATIVRVNAATGNTGKEPSVLVLNQANFTNPALKLTLAKETVDLATRGRLGATCRLSFQSSLCSFVVQQM